MKEESYHREDMSDKERLAYNKYQRKWYAINRQKINKQRKKSRKAHKKEQIIHYGGEKTMTTEYKGAIKDYMIVYNKIRKSSNYTTLAVADALSHTKLKLKTISSYLSKFCSLGILTKTGNEGKYNIYTTTQGFLTNIQLQYRMKKYKTKHSGKGHVYHRNQPIAKGIEITDAEEEKQNGKYYIKTLIGLVIYDNKQEWEQAIKEVLR